MSVQRLLQDAIRLKQPRVLRELYRKTEHAVWLLQTPKKFWAMLATKRHERGMATLRLSASTRWLDGKGGTV